MLRRFVERLHVALSVRVSVGRRHTVKDYLLVSLMGALLALDRQSQ